MTWNRRTQTSENIPTCPVYRRFLLFTASCLANPIPQCPLARPGSHQPGNQNGNRSERRFALTSRQGTCDSVALAKCLRQKVPPLRPWPKIGCSLDTSPRVENAARIHLLVGSVSGPFQGCSGRLRAPMLCKRAFFAANRCRVSK